jgi:hypothetical protein
MVDAMLNLVRDEAARIDSRILESACGSGNYIVAVLKRKLSTVEAKYRTSAFDRRHYALLAVMCIYGIELLADNISECRSNMLKTLMEELGLDEHDETIKAATHVIETNLVHGDAMTMLDSTGEPIVFAEWGYLGKGKFQRRDFRLASLTTSASFGEEGTLFADLGSHELFTPVKTYQPVTVRDLAEASS